MHKTIKSSHLLVLTSILNRFIVLSSASGTDCLQLCVPLVQNLLEMSTREPHPQHTTSKQANKLMHTRTCTRTHLPAVELCL
jgi:hypothetical protein